MPLQRAARHVTCWHPELLTCQILALSLAESAYRGGCASHRLICTGPACWQVRQSTQANVMPGLQALCKQELEARQQHEFTSQSEPWLQRKKGQELVWAVSCHASSLVFSTQTTPGRWGLTAKVAPAMCGYHACCSLRVRHMQERLWPPLLPPKLGLYLGLWHLQLQPQHRLPDQQASSLQQSELHGVGKLFFPQRQWGAASGHCGSLAEMAFQKSKYQTSSCFHFDILSSSLTASSLTWYKVLQRFRKLLCFVLLSLAVLKVLLLSL